jgi:hypothetical protein
MLQPFTPTVAPTPTTTVAPPRPAEIRGEPVQVTPEAVSSNRQLVERQRQDERARENEQRNGGRLFDARNARQASQANTDARGSQLDISV